MGTPTPGPRSAVAVRPSRVAVAAALAGLLALAVVATGLAGSWRGDAAAHAVAPASPARSTSPSSATPCGVSGRPAQWDHVVWIVMENKSPRDILGNRSAPYTNQIVARCGLATDYRARTHPSLPNYIAMTAGRTGGITDDADPSAHRLRIPSIFSQLGRGGWRTLAESMPGNCWRVNAGDYAVRHNPATYFRTIRRECARQDVPLRRKPRLSARFTFVVPNIMNDSHSASVATGDRWLSHFMPKVLDSAQYRAGRTAVFLTYDEDDGSRANRVVTLVIAPSTQPGTRVSTRFTHYSLLRTTEEMLGLRLLARARSATSMRSGFGL